MTQLVRLLACAVQLLLTVSAFATQAVGSLTIDYPHAFNPQPAEAEQWLSQMPASATAQIKGLDVFKAQATPGLGEVRIVRILYVAGVKPGLDGAVNQSLQNILNLPGHSNVAHDTRVLRVSGRDARQTSFQSNRFGGKLGAEFLFVLDMKTNAIYQMQFLFAKRKPQNPLTTLDLEKERAAARALLATVSFIN